MFRRTPTSLLILDPDLTIVEASDAYLAATMTRREEIVGRYIFDAFPDNPDDPEAHGVEAIGASLRRVLHDRAPDVMPVQKYDVPQPGGGFATRYWAPMHAPVLDAHGGLHLIVQRAEDVTAFMVAQTAGGELGRLTEQLRRSIGQAEAEILARRQMQQQQHETMQVLADSLKTAVFGCDELGRPVLCNDAARAIAGDRLVGARAEQWPQRLHLRDPAGNPLTDAGNPLVSALRGQRVCEAEVVMRVPGTPARTFRMYAGPLKGRVDVVALVAMDDVTALRDATRLKECELEISKLLSRAEPTDEVLAEVVELIGSMIGWAATEVWIVDEVGEVLRRASCWAAAGHAAVCGAGEPLPPDDGLPARAWQTNQPQWATDLDGRWAPLSAALAIPVPSGTDVLGVLVCYCDTAEVPDDTRTAILTGIGAQLGGFLEHRRAGSLAAELDRTRDEYAALVGHEVRTPLTSIQAYTELLLDEPDLADDHREMVQVMYRNAGTLSIVVDKLLDVAGMRSGHIAVHRRAMDLASVVRAAADAARERVHRDVTIDVNAPGTVPIRGDADRLRQVADELLNNALIWATEHSTVGVQVTADAHAAVLTVSNTGEPIPADERDRLFDLFFRGGAALHSGLPGSGLGLTLARAVVEQHGGTIGVSDPAEALTLFTVRLPTGRTSDHPG
ncbi:sensor histidine kinase [Actinoplanes ianthinogenes]|uniref:sensor histidine kinase n=1 Tax=Actinoplanes ianthinogenes TaxID=122358 RepID=UPI001E2A54CC|nr:ATP-binding protein [Actinoplanes ianthinogenes]